MCYVKKHSEKKELFYCFNSAVKTSVGHLAVVDGLHMVLEAFQYSTFNSRVWKVAPEGNTCTIWEEGLLVYHGFGVGN